MTRLLIYAIILYAVGLADGVIITWAVQWYQRPPAITQPAPDPVLLCEHYRATGRGHTCDLERMT